MVDGSKTLILERLNNLSFENYKNLYDLYYINPNMTKIIKFFRERPVLSLVLIFRLQVNSITLPDANIGTVRQYNPLETTISNQKALMVSGGDGFTNPYKNY